MLKKFLLIFLSLLLIVGCCSCAQNTPKDTEGDEKPTEDGTPADKVVLSGETRYRIVYPKDSDPAPARKIYNRLKALDKSAVSDDYYLLTTDEAPDDGTPEILVGATNRSASSEAKEALATYLDFSVTVKEKKIVIFANTEERLSDATKYFAEELVKTDSGMIYYPTSALFVDTYAKYPVSTLKIANASINAFSIILPAAATDEEKETANDIQLWLAENTGAVLPIKADTEPATANEIIIGRANRTECSAYPEGYEKDVYFSLNTIGSKLLLFAGEQGTYAAAISEFKQKIRELNGELSELEIFKSKSGFKDKKAIFIGNSFIYWGGCVTFIPYYEENDPVKDAADVALRLEGADKGYFSQICKANGAEIDVYNFTYGGKSLSWLYEKKLSGLEKEFLESIDYVFISEAGGGDAKFLETMESIMALFPNAEEFTYLAHEFAYRTDDKNVISKLPTLAEKGVNIVAWGELVCDVYNGEIAVPEAKQSYNRNSFVKHSTGLLPVEAAVTTLDGKGDSHHQNPLAGYITAQMAFSAISGCSSVGQEYEFCWDKTIAPQYDLENFLTCQYNEGQTSNFIEIFNSPDDMKGLQQLMDSYMKKHN